MWSSMDLPSLPPSLHLVCKRYIIGPDVKLPLTQAQHATVNTSAVDAHSHVYIDSCHFSHQPVVAHMRKCMYYCQKSLCQLLFQWNSETISCNVIMQSLLFGVCGCDLRDGLNHVYSHFHTAVGVVSPRFRQPWHTVVTVPKDFNTQAVILLYSKSAHTHIIPSTAASTQQAHFKHRAFRHNLDDSSVSE